MVILLLVFLKANAQIDDNGNNDTETDLPKKVNTEATLRLNGSFGMSFNSTWIVNQPSFFVKNGFGFKLSEHFWLNADIFAMRYASTRTSNYYTNWTFAPNISKDFSLGGKFTAVASLGLFITLEEVNRTRLSHININEITGEEIRVFKTDEEQLIDVGAIVSLKLMYEVKKNFMIGIDFTGYAYYYMPLEEFLIGPVIEFRL